MSLDSNGDAVLDNPAVRPPAFAAKHWAWAHWVTLLTALTGLSLCLALGLARQQQRLASEQSQVHEALSAVRTRLEAVAQATFGPTLALEAMIQLDHGISAERFDALSQRVVNLLPQVRSIVVAPDDVVRYVYPLDGNGAVLGLRYASIPLQYAQVQQARQQGHPLLVGPVKLVQGGEGIIQRTPVFFASPNGQPPAYWGVVSVVADLPRFVQAAGLSDNSPLRLALFQWRADSQSLSELIWGDASLAKEALAVTQFVHLPGATWAIAAYPRHSRAAASTWLDTEMIAGLLASAVLSLLAALLVQRRRHLQTQNLALNQYIQQIRDQQLTLQATEQRFRSLTEISSDWVWEQDAEFRFVYYSRESDPELRKYTPTLIGQKRWEGPQAGVDIDWTEHIALLKRHEPFRDFGYGRRLASGEMRYISISGSPIFDAQGRFTGYRGTGRDITATKSAELALRASEAALSAAKDRLQAVLDSAREVAIIVTDMEGQIELFNHGAQLMLGYAEDEMLNRCINLLHGEEELLARGVQIIQEGGRTLMRVDPASVQAFDTQTSFWIFVRKDGAELEVSLTVNLMREQDGSLKGWLCIARDVSAERQAQRALVTLNAELEMRVDKRTAELQQALVTLRQAQAELMRSEKMAALGSLVAGIAHELNTPLGNCLTTASTLESLTQQVRRDFDAGQIRRSVLDAYLADAQTACAILLRSMSTATELVAHFKQVSVDQATAQRRSFTLQSLVSDVLSLLGAQLRKSPLQIEQQIQLTEALDSYPGPLGQVLTNLVMNAMIHAFDPPTAERKEGDAEGTPAPEQRLRIEAEIDPTDPAMVILSVVDNGKGMSADIRRRAFDPFFTTKMGQGGTGLGLNIVYNIVTGILGGQIELQSEPGVGSRFVMRLPIMAPMMAH
ncbi:PAS domain S-box protein [Paucibacter sp. KCTC 42545]|uniref:PAS domain S-box protein n=1 Tax=Paucibacter sp. KCTC 42545 TaxID=1768242 RepID=UPI000733A384|nr:PAS domain S-box protein [Paucibacter sp. KCTC 42545]ALT77368.1 hypothetical protein AT984_09355 [Paucibacter sp. KCTC 42545]